MDEKSSPCTSHKAKAKSSPNEESLGISTSSSWTILPADRIEILDNTSGSEESSAANTPGERGRELSSKDEHTNDRSKLVDDADPQAEDVSDGISIISDCESTGRISPHPLMRDLLTDLSYKFDSGHNLPETSTEQLIRERRRVALELNDAPQPLAEPTETSHVVRTQTNVKQSSAVGYHLPPLVQSGLTAVFYVGATLAVLAFIGRLRNPEWQVLGGDKSIEELEQRLTELELQNNLMRAEIDIMSKQLHYLNSLTGNGPGQGQAHAQSQGRKGKMFKAWPGNGNSVDPVDITKEDLKRPYKCPDGKYVEIAGMCMESKPHAESLTDEIGNVVNNVLRQSQAFQNFEKVTERLGTLAGKDAEQATGSASETPKAFHAHAEKMGYPTVRPPTPSMDTSRGPVSGAMPLHNTKADASKERYKTKHYHKHQEHSKEHNRYKTSGERDSKDRDSKERYNRKHYDKSKEQHGRKRYGGENDDSGSNEWHEQRMQHREHSRQRKNDNWFIERGGSREQMRSEETKR